MSSVAIGNHFSPSEGFSIAEFDMYPLAAITGLQAGILAGDTCLFLYFNLEVKGERSLFYLLTFFSKGGKWR